MLSRGQLCFYASRLHDILNVMVFSYQNRMISLMQSSQPTASQPSRFKLFQFIFGRHLLERVFTSVVYFALTFL